eukprot:1161401-Pelagomonas_calceolata.AAC.4
MVIGSGIIIQVHSQALHTPWRTHPLTQWWGRQQQERGRSTGEPGTAPGPPPGPGHSCQTSSTARIPCRSCTMREV